LSILREFSRRVKKYHAESNKRAKRRLARARTQSAREREQSQIEKNRLADRIAIAEARTALAKAESARKRAELEVKSIGRGTGTNLFSSLSDLFTPSAPKRRVHRSKKRIAA